MHPQGKTDVAPLRGARRAFVDVVLAMFEAQLNSPVATGEVVGWGYEGPLSLTISMRVRAGRRRPVETICPKHSDLLLQRVSWWFGTMTDGGIDRVRR